jgi:ribosomal protein S18 acetylase RimI-like enzyme
MLTVTGSPDGRWTATQDGEVVGVVRTLVRPDQRCYLFFRNVVAGAYVPLLDGVLASAGPDLYTSVAETGADVLAALARRGFVVHRREHLCALPTDIGHPPMPAGVRFVSAADSDVDRLRELDDALRQHVPGTDGWRNDPSAFGRQTFEDPEFDPATYLIAVDADGAYVGLVRVWVRQAGSRLGLIGVLPAHQRRGIALALLAEALGVLHGRGESSVGCEVDQANVASNSLMARLGARLVGGDVELVLRR